MLMGGDNLLASVLATMGSYPVRTYDSKGTLISERTPWQEGWNSAISTISERLHMLRSKIDELTQLYGEDVIKKIVTLLNEHLLFANFIGMDIMFTLNVNDVFLPAADDEEVCVENLPEVIELYDKFGDDGLLAWVSKKRNWAQPRHKYQQFDEAVMYIKEKM